MSNETSQSQQGAQGGEGGQGGGAGAGSGNGQQQGTQSQGTQGQQSTGFDAAGLSQDQVNEILEKNPHIWKNERLTRLKEKGQKFDDAEAAAAEAEANRLKNEGKFKELNDKLTTENSGLKEQIQNLNTNQSIMSKLAGSGVVDAEAALALIDRSNIKVDDNGTVSGVDEAIESLKKSKAYLFNGNGGSSSVGSATNSNGAQGSGEGATFKRSQLKNPKFYAENREAILKAAAAGKIEDDL